MKAVPLTNTACVVIGDSGIFNILSTGNSGICLMQGQVANLKSAIELYWEENPGAKPSEENKASTNTPKIFKTPSYLLFLEKTDHGIDGWSPSRTVEAIFTDQNKALNYLEKIDYTHAQYGAMYHKDEKKRGSISYRLVEKNVEINPE